MRVCVCAFMVNEAHLKGMKMQKIVRLMMVLAVLGLVAACATETSTKPQEQTAFHKIWYLIIQVLVSFTFVRGRP